MAGAFTAILAEPHDLPQGAGAEADASSEEDTKPVSRDPEPSVGAAMHGTGECKPCAWFWKPKGCLNGEECLHCHLCPSSALKARKKQLLQYKREAEALLSSAPEPLCVPLPAEVCYPPPGLSLPAGGEDSACQLPYPTLLESSHHEASGLEKAIDKLARNDNLPGFEIANDKLADLLPSTSLGSALHGSGRCKPCAWYWHAKGCANGEACEYCHECPPGELKERRKVKIQYLRSIGVQFSKRASTDSPNLPPDSLALNLQASLADDLGEEVRRAEKAKDVETEDESADLAPNTDAAGAEVSVGSANHATGQCRPCAWFWKPGGCQNGKECLHCHLCPPGELQRKKKERQPVRKLSEQGVQRPSEQRVQRPSREPTMKVTKQIKNALNFQQQVIQHQQQQLLQMQMQLQMQQHLQQQMMMATASHLASSCFDDAMAP